MTTSEKEEYHRRVEGIALQYGFTYSHRGCPCSGAQLIYTAFHGKNRYELNVWHARGEWRLLQNKTKVAEGTTPEYLQAKIEELWDLDN